LLLEAHLKKIAFSKFFIYRMIAGLLLLAFAAGFVPPAAAQQAGPQMNARAAFDGNFKYGEWMPIWVELENSGADVNGSVQVRVLSGAVNNVFEVPVSLPGGSRKRLPVYILPNNFSREIQVDFISGGKSAATQKIQVRPQPNISYFIGIVSAERGALSLLSGITLPGQHRPRVLADISLADLPDRVEGMRSFDLLILNDVDTSLLTTVQTQVLSNWVRLGGRLVLGGGAGAQRTALGLPEELLPVVPAGLVDISASSLNGLERYVDGAAAAPSGTFTMAVGEVKEGRTLVETSDKQPLVRELNYGSGWVNFIALDLSASPFEGWSSTAKFWETMVSPGAAYPEGLAPDISMRQMRSGGMPYALSNMPVLDLPSLQGISILLGFYILLIGPLNYLFLRWRRRLHMAWVTIPILTAVFSAGTFGLGFTMRGSDILINKIAMVELQPGGTANLITYIGLFSPGQGDYQVEVGSAGLLSPLTEYYDPWGGGFSGTAGGAGEMVFVQGDPSAVRGLSVGQWSLRSFMSEDVWNDFGGLHASLALDGDMLTGVVRNDTDYTLSDAVVVLGKRFMRLGDLEPGEEVEVKLQFRALNNDRWGPPLSYMLFEEQFNQPSTGRNRELEMKRSIIESTFERGPWVKMGGMRAPGLASTSGINVMFLVWMNEAPPEIRVGGRAPAQQATTLVYSPLTYSIPTQGAVSLAPGLVPGTLIQSPKEGGYCGEPGSPSVYIVNGEALFEFQAPQELSGMDISTLKLSLWTDGGWWGSPELALYDWNTQEWAVLSETIQGVNVVMNSESLVNDLGLIRVRMSGKNLQSCYFLDMGLEAQR
jgi:hypothetical protein